MAALKVSIISLFILLNVVPSQQQLLSALSPSGFFKVTEGLKELAGAVQHGDFMLVGLKLLETLRVLIKIIHLPGFSELDQILQMIHGVVESVRPVVLRFTRNTGAVIQQEMALRNNMLGAGVGVGVVPEMRSSPSLLQGGVNLVQRMSRSLG